MPRGKRLVRMRGRSRSARRASCVSCLVECSTNTRAWRVAANAPSPRSIVGTRRSVTSHRRARRVMTLVSKGVRAVPQVSQDYLAAAVRDKLDVGLTEGATHQDLVSPKSVPGGQ